MKTMQRLLILIALVAIFAFIPACGCDDDDDDDSGTSVDDDDDDDDSGDDDDDNDASDDDDDDDADDCDEATHDPLIVLGKEALSAMDPDGAYEDFESALTACPDSRDARAGKLIARAQWLTIWFFDAVENPPFAKGIGEDLQQLFTEEILPVTGEMFTLADDLLANYGDVRFYVDPLPFVVDDGHVLLELSGEWDRNDIANAKAYARLFEGIGRTLAAFNLVYDEDLFADNPVGEDATLIEQIHHIADLLLQMYGDSQYDEFLRLLDGGQESLAEGGTHLGLGLREIKANIYATRDETDNQEDDICGYVDANGNGVWDEGETFRVPYFGALVPEVNDLLIDLIDLIDALGIAFLDRGPEDIHPRMPDWFFLSELNFLLALTDVLDPTHPIRLPPVPLPVGRWFYMVDEDGWRPIAEPVTSFLWGITRPAP